MESENDRIADTVIKWCNCGCDCCSEKVSDCEFTTRSVKRKLDERDDDDDEVFVSGVSNHDVARVDIGNECAALREMVNSQQEMIQELSVELDEERNAASSAANEAMSMILRLQSEKAEVQMEARQFKRFSEDRMAHDQQEILALEDCLYKREETIEALTYEMQAYKHRMLSYGLTEYEVYGENRGLLENSVSQFEFPSYNYPPLRCNLIENNTDHDDETVDVEKYPFGESPRSLTEIEERINELERSPTHSPVHEKGIIGNSPQNLSSASCGSFIDTKEDLKKVDSVSDFGDDMSDRIVTVDSIQNLTSFDNDVKVKKGVYDESSSTRNDIGDIEVKKLYARLHALEADRESMKQALISMRTDKAQLVLLKEIAQHLSKDISSPRRTMPVKKKSVFGNFSIFVLFKWLVSFLLWRRSTHRTKYTFGMSPSNAGLRMVVDKGPQMEQWRCLSKTRFLKY